MKKNIFLFVLPLLLSSHLFGGEDNFQFAGITLSTISSDFKTEDNKKDAALGIRYGLQSTEWRTMVSLEKDYRGYKSATIETDYLFNTLDIDEVHIKPYIGLSVGYYDHKDNDDKHAIFGLHSGAIVNVSREIDFDFGVSYKQKRDTKHLSKVGQLTFAVHYFF